MAYDTLASEESIQKAVAGLAERNIVAHVVNTKEEALEKVKTLIPAGVSVTTGASVTLEQIGFVDLLKSGDHPWKNLKEAVVAEKDPAKQALLRKQSVLADYFLASVHALAETGELVIASATGSQLPSVAFTSDHVIWVVGAQKIVPTLEDGLKRLREYVFPLEDKHMKGYGYPGSTLAKILLFEREAASSKRTIQLVLVKEVLGY